MKRISKDSVISVVIGVLFACVHLLLPIAVVFYNIEILYPAASMFIICGVAIAFIFEFAANRYKKQHSLNKAKIIDVIKTFTPAQICLTAAFFVYELTMLIDIFKIIPINVFMLSIYSILLVTSVVLAIIGAVKKHKATANQKYIAANEEYFSLRKEQLKVRKIGIILCLSILFIPTILISDIRFLAILTELPAVVGIILIIRSFFHQKYAELKYVDFDGFESAGSVSSQQPIAGASYSINIYSNRIYSCFIGGAAGDALGYAVKDLSYDEIISQYGKNGIQALDIDSASGKALISDDIQLALFTAEALLKSDGDTIDNFHHSYLNWLQTQQLMFEQREPHPESELMSRQELYHRRSPEQTNLIALSSGKFGTVTNPINSAMGSGALMRAAPIAFLKNNETIELDKLAIQSAALTHGHPLGYLPAALFVHILHNLIYEQKEKSLNKSIGNSVAEFSMLFSSAPYFDDFINTINKAIALSDNAQSDINNIKAIGNEQTAAQTLAIAVYCALRYPNDYSKAVAASVNHGGESDSTGAVTGSIIGAYLGEQRIAPEWKTNLELCDVIARFSEKFAD